MGEDKPVSAMTTAERVDVCMNCRWWERETERRGGRDPVIGKCGNPKFRYMGDLPGSTLWSDYTWAIETHLWCSDALIYWDAEGWGAGVFTGERFGCVHYESLWMVQGLPSEDAPRNPYIRQALDDVARCPHYALNAVVSRESGAVRVRCSCIACGMQVDRALPR